MKHSLLVLSVIILPLSLFSQVLNEKIEKLVQYYPLAISDSATKEKTIFFNSFPSDFTEFCRIYGYEENASGNDGSVYAPLYSDAYEHVTLFCSLCGFIPNDQYYKRMIDIAIDGYWQADAVNCFKQCLIGYLLPQTHPQTDQIQSFFDTEYFFSTLEKYDDESVASFWNFYFDAPYVAYAKELHQKTEIVIKSHPRLFRIMNREYRKVLRLLKKTVY